MSVVSNKDAVAVKVAFQNEDTLFVHTVREECVEWDLELNRPLL